MQKINFQNLPNTTTPVSAGNLNQLQDNVEDVFDGDVAMGNINTTGVKINNTPIIDSGSNTNGNYIKYQDGTMICWKTITGNTHSNNVRYGDGFFYMETAYASTSPENAISWTFPETFISIPTVSVNVVSSANTISSLGTTTTTYTTGYCVTPYAVNSITFLWNFIAIGKWK